jgi:hypothetical protein
MPAVTPISDLQSGFFDVSPDVILGITVDQVIHFLMNQLCGFKLFGEGFEKTFRLKKSRSFFKSFFTSVFSCGVDNASTPWASKSDTPGAGTPRDPGRHRAS